MSGFKAFLTMWTRPKETIRGILNTNPDSKLFLLSLIYGLPMMFYFCQGASLGQTYNLSTILLLSILGACVLGYLGLNLGAFLIFMTGKWVGGKANFKQVRASVAYSNVTNLVSIALWLLLAGLFKQSVFLADFAYVSSLGHFAVIMNAIFVIQLVVGVWSLIIFVASLSETQGFSILRSIINTLLPIGVIFIGFWILGLLYTLFSARS